MQNKYQKTIKQQNQQIQQLQFQLNNLKMDYYNIMRQGNNKKKKSVVNPNIMSGIGNIVIGKGSNQQGEKIGNNNNNYYSTNNNYNSTNNNNHHSGSNNVDDINDKQRKDSAMIKMLNTFTNNNSNNTAIDHSHNLLSSTLSSILKSNTNIGNNKKTKNNNTNTTNNNPIRQVYQKRVRFEDIYLPLLHLYSFIQDTNNENFALFSSNSSSNSSSSQSSILPLINTILYKLIQDDDDIVQKNGYISSLSYNNNSIQKRKKCYELMNVFMDEPFFIQRKEAIKLARYIVEDETNIVGNMNMNGNNSNSNSNTQNNKNSSKQNNDKVIYNENNSADLNLVKSILKSSLSKLHEKDNKQKYDQKWLQILNRNNSRKMLQTLQQYQNGLISEDALQQQPNLKQSHFLISHIKLDELIELLNSKTTRKKIQPDDYQYITIKCFDKEKSQNYICLNIKKIQKFFDNVMYGENIKKNNNRIKHEDNYG